MGNQLSGTVPQQIHPVEYYLSELSGSELLTFDCNMGSTRFFKVARIKLHQSRTQLSNSFGNNRLISHMELNTTSSRQLNTPGQLEPEIPSLGVAKVFVINDPSLPLRAHRERIEQIAQRLSSLSNCLTYKKLIVNDRVAVLLRQFIKFNLYDRLSTRPFLSLFEKKWLAFQLLRCIQSLHSNGVTHGDIKLENVLITSSGWVLLTDFASYKPTYLPEDNPADFSYFFDTSRRRICNVAPERFVSESCFNEPMEQFATVAVEATPLTSNTGQPALSNVTPEMDMFSLGCVLCELFAEDSLFDLSTLLVYRTKGLNRRGMSRNESGSEPLDQVAVGASDLSIKLSKSKDGKDSPLSDQVDGQGFPPNKVLNQIELPEIRELVKQLIDLRPDERGDCGAHIETLMEKKVFPRFFEPLHRYLTGFNQLSADEKILKLYQDLSELSQIIIDESSSGLLLLINNVLPCLRSLKHVHAKITSINLLLKIIRCNRDADLINHLILERTLPYFMDFIAKDPSPKVKAHTIQCLTEMLALINSVPTSDKNVFLDYILPVLCKAVSDDSALVRMQLARDLPQLSLIALQYLHTYNSGCNSDSSDSTKPTSEPNRTSKVPSMEDQEGARNDLSESNLTSKKTIDSDLDGLSSNRKSDESNSYLNILASYENLSKYSSELKALRRAFQHITHYILTDREISIRIELMLNPKLVQLCTFFDKQKTNEIIFSHLITFLNERSDFELRSAFFQCIISIGCFLGSQSSPLLKPLLQQGFTDPEESVINQALNSTAQLAELEMIPKKATIELLTDAMPLIVHPNLWIRHSLVRLITCCSAQLNLAELNCKLLPLIRPFLTSDQQEHLLYLSNTVSDTSLLMDNLVSPIPRVIFDLVLNKITSSAQLDAFFETLEKRKMIRIASLTLTKNSGSSSSLTSLSAVSPTLTHQSLANLNAANLINLGSKGMVNSATNSIVLANTNHLSYCAPTSLITLFDLLIEEGLNDQIELNLIRMSELLKRLYRQIRSIRCSVTASPFSGQNKQTLPKPVWNMGSKGQSFISISGDESGSGQIKRKNKRLFSVQLSEQSSKTNNEAEWHITSSISGESSTNDDIVTNAEYSNCCSFEIGKEAKELGDGELSTDDVVVPSITDTSNIAYGIRISDNRAPSFGSVSCPPCVSDLNHLTRHKQFKFGESIGNGAILDSCASFASNITLTTATPHSSTSVDLNESNNQSRTLARYARITNGHYALSSFRPQGRLIANLFEHTGAISKLVSIDCGGAGKGTMFASSSLDGSIRLWDASKMNLGKNLINKSKQVFDLRVFKQSSEASETEAINGMTYSYGRESLVGYSSTGDLYVIKVDGRSSKMSLAQRLCNFGSNFSEPNVMSYSSNAKSIAQEAKEEMSSETDPISTTTTATATRNTITDISSNSPFVFACSFSNSNINAFDLRMPLQRPIWKFATHPDEGLITCITEGDYSIFAGTSYGKIAIFDTRFNLRSNSMCYNFQKRIRKLLYTPQGLFASVQGYNEISLWSCESGSRLKTLWASNAPPLTNNTSNNSVHSLIAGALTNGEFSSLITCSSDARIRYWDLANPHRSYIMVDNAYRTVSGSSAPASGLGTGSAFSIASGVSSTSQVNYICKFMEGMQVIQEYHLQEDSTNAPTPTGSGHANSNNNATGNGIGSTAKDHSTGGAFNNYHSWDPQAISPSHKDVITDICWINSCNLLASGSRDGCIKLWK